MMSDTDDSGFSTYDFSEKSVRMGFIRKVYCILCCQLTITVGFIAIFLFVPEVKNYFLISEENKSPPGLWLFYTAMVATFVLLIVLACCENVRRTYPTNFIVLAAFTLCESLLLGVVTATYDVESVLIAAGITVAVTLGLTLFAFQTKWDFTMAGGILFVSLIVLILFGLLAAIFRSHVLNIVYAAVGALIFSVYIVFDTQLMIGGDHRYQISPEEYVFAALNLYLDIINLFLLILRLVAEKDRRSS